MVPWQSRRHPEDHFHAHGAEVGAATIEEFDASANATLLHADVIFGYDDPETGLPRSASYDSVTGLYVAVNDDDEIVTHYRTNDAYILRPRTRYGR